MRHNTSDKTLERNYLEKYRFLISEYEQVKAGTHAQFHFAQDFYKAHDTDRRSFLKYYNRYKQSGSETDLLPQKRSPRYKTRRPVEDIEQKVLALRQKGNNRYEVRCFNILSEHYQIRFEEVLTDNGAEFAIHSSKQKQGHPFERMLIELGIVHRYIKPYRPQTNGKVERFWRTIEEDMLTDTFYDSEAKLNEELLHYLYYYNHERHHQGINNIPVVFKNLLPN